MKESTKNGLLVVGSVLLTALLFGLGVELVERVRYSRWKTARMPGLHSFVASPDPELVWENRPFAVVGKGSINRWGFRDTDYDSRAKPGGTRRIAFAGDSVTFGLYADAEDVFVKVLGRDMRRLREDERVQLMNFSVVGYDAAQVSALIREKVLPFAPDVVIYALCLNDFDSDDFSSELVRYFRPPTSFVWQRLKSARRDENRDAYIEEYVEANKERAAAEISKVATTLGEKSVDFRVVILPVFDGTLASFEEYSFGAVHATIAASLQARHVAVVDLLPYFRDCAELSPSAYAGDFWHLNELGHRFVARALLDAVLARELPEPREPEEAVCRALRRLEPREDASERDAFEKSMAGGKETPIAIDSSLLVLRGLWPVEHVDDRAYAWTKEDAVIRVRGLHAGAGYRVVVRIADVARRPRVDAGPRGAELHAFEPPTDVLELPTSLTADQDGAVDVELRTETWRPSASGSEDPRSLGVAIAGVDLAEAR